MRRHRVGRLYSLLALLGLALLGLAACGSSARAATILSHYPFNGDATNAVLGAPNGTLVGGPVFIAGHDGTPNGALDFNGTSQYVDVTTSGHPNSAAGLAGGSLSFWMKSNTTVLDAVTGAFNTGSNMGFQFETLANGNLRIFVRSDGGSQFDVQVADPAAWRDDQWHHIAATWQVGVGGTIFIDGVPKTNATNNLAATGALTPWAFPMLIGARSNRATPDEQFDGAIDDYRVYSGRLTYDEVRTLAGKDAPVAAGPAQSVRIDFGSATSADVSDTETGFTTMNLTQKNPAIDALGLRVGLYPLRGAHLDSRDRGLPIDNPPNLTQDQLYDDFVFANGVVDGDGLGLLLEGLAPNQQYELTLWSYDDSSAGDRISDWTEVTGGVVIADNYTFNGTNSGTNAAGVGPAADFDSTMTAIVTSNAEGVLRIEGVRQGGTSHGVFLNAIQLAPVPEPSTIALALIGACGATTMMSRRRTKR